MLGVTRPKQGPLFIDWGGKIAIEQYPDGDIDLGPVDAVLDDERVEVLLPSEVILAEDYIETKAYLESLGSPWSKFIGVWGTHSDAKSARPYLRIGVWFGKLLDQAKLSKRWGLPEMSAEALESVLEELETYLQEHGVGIDQMDYATVDVLAYSPSEAANKINVIVKFFQDQPDLVAQLARL